MLSVPIADVNLRGRIAVCGNAAAQLMRNLAGQGCSFLFNSIRKVVHTAREDVLGALEKGDAFFSRLEGE